ncbi:MAG: autotransporter-associated beta strand protein, partial [Pirellulaceae bacterium]
MISSKSKTSARASQTKSTRARRQKRQRRNLQLESLETRQLLAAGDIAIFHVGSFAGEDLAGGTDPGADIDSLPGPDFIHDFDPTAVRSSGAHILQANNQDIALEAGHHLVIYNTRFDKQPDFAGNENRSEIQTNLNLNGVDLAAGFAQGFDREFSDAREAIISGGSIIDVQSSGDLLKLKSFRTDADTNPSVRVNDNTGIQLLKLNDSDDFLILSGDTGPRSAGDQAVTTGFQAVDFGVSQEADMGSFGHSTSTNPGDITLKTAGHYLVFANTYGYGATSRVGMLQRLTLDGTRIDGSESYVYLRGNDVDQNTDEGAATIGMIVETSSANQILNVQVRGETDRTVRIDGARTAVTIVKLDDAGDYVRLVDTSNDQNINSTRDIDFDDAGSQVELDAAAFSHSISTNSSRIGVTQDDDYLFFASQYDTNGGATRGVYNQRWEKNDDGQPFQYGQTGAYNRNQGGQSDQLGNWSGLLVDLNGGEFIQATSRAVGVAGTNNANRLGLQGVRISTIFGRSPVIDNVTGDTTIYIPASGPQLLDQPGPGDALVTDDQADFNGGSLTVSFAAGGEATDALTIDNAAANNGSNAITVAAGTVSHNGLAIGTISGGGSGTPLVITFTSTDATPAAASDLIQSILYEDGGDAAANVNKDVEFALNDGVSAATIVTSNVSLARLLGPETLHVWDGNADSDGDGVSWNDPLNWVADIVPDANDVAVFNNTGSGFPAVDLGAAVRFIGGLALDAGGYTIENGTLLIVNSSATTGVLTQDAAVSGSTNSVAARINSPTLSAILNGGTLELTDTTNNIGPTGSFIVNEGSSLRAEVDLTSSALGEAEVTVNGPITPPVVSSDVNISIFQAATAGEVLTGGTNTNTPGPDFIQDFDTTVRADGAHTLQPGGQDIALDSGHHLVIYNSRFNKGAGGTEDRSQVQTNFNLDGTDLSTGWSNGFIRLQEGQNETITAGGAIIDVQNDGDLLQLQSFRTDTDTNATTRANGESAIQLVKLDDSWDYLSLSGNDGAGPDQIIPNSTSAFTAVNYTASQEADAGSFGHNTATNPADITLNTAGHYLVMANTYAYGASSRESILQRLTLDGAMVAGSQTSVYLRGNDINQLTDEGAASIGMIIETTGANQILNVEITQDVGRTGMSIDGDRTGLTIVKLPDGGDYIRLLDTSNNQNINSTRELNFDDAGSELEIDGSFTHSNPSQIAANASGDYLFFASQYDVDDGAARGFYNQRWEKNNGTPFAYGQTGRYSRSTGGADQFGNWSGLLVDLDGGDFVQATTRVLGNAGTNNANTLGLQGVSLTSFFTSQPEGLELFSTSGNPTVNLTNNVTATDRATILLTGITSASLGDLTTVGGAFLTVESNNGATLEFRGDAGSGVDISGTGDGVLGGVAETTINPTNDTTLALNNVDSNADVQIVGTGVVELSGPNVNNDATWFVEGGTLSVADDLGFGNNPSPVVDSGTLLLDGVDLPVGATIVLRGGTLTNDGDSSVDIVNLEADSEIDSTSGTLTISEINTIDDDPIVADAVPATVGYAVTFSGAAATIVTGAIGNSVALPAAAPGSVVQDGNGDVTLSGVSNYDGATSIVDGTLILLGPNGNLGDDFTGTTVTAGAALQLEGGVSVPTELISIFGTGDGAGNGALRNESGTNSVGNLDLAGDADIRVVADTLNIMGTVDLDNELTFRGAATANITAQVTGNGGDIIKFGSGVVALTNSANDFDGDIDVRDGTLRITSDGTLGNATGTTTVSDAGNQNTTLEFSGAFDYTDAETILFVGPGDNNGGALRNDNGDTTIGPNVALFTTGDATIFNAAANSIFTIDADVSSLFALTVDGSGDTVISGDVSTLDLSGVAPIVANYSDVIASLDNVEGYWEFEDAVTTDSSANNRNGTLTGSLATGNPVAGQVGDSIEFTTNTDHVVVTGYKGITGAAARSMAAWVRFEGTDNNQGIMHWGTNLTGQKWTFRVQDTDGQAGAIRVEVNGSAIVGNVDIRDGQWHHVAAVLEPGSVSAGSTIEDIRLYVDGQIDAGVRPGDPTPSAVVGNANLAINTASVNDVRIGLNESTSDWEGGIDEPAIFSDAITGGEIAAMHASGRFGGTSIIKNGAGQLTLSGTNTFLGETDVNEGVVIATNSSSLGSVLGGGGMELSAGTIVADGATLALDGSGGALLITESLALSGNGTTIDVDGDHADDITPAIGALVSFGGDNEVIGSITATGSEIGIGTADNVLTITSDVDLSFAKVAFSGGGDSVVNGDISGVGGFDYATQLLGLGPDAYWQFEDASGSTTATDSSPNGHDGDVAAPIAVSNPVAGIVGNAFDFDNTNNAITATGYQGVTGTAARTISAFVKVEGTDANQSFMHWGTNVGGQKWTFRIQDGNGSIDGNLRLEVNGGFITGTTDIRDGQWHHVAMVFDPGSVSGASEVEDIRLYVDGALDAGVGTGTPPNAITNRAINTASGNDVRIGLDEGTRDWEGLVDEAAIFARALSPSEVFALAQISPDNQLMKMGSGMLTLAGDNSYDGATTVMAGALNVQSNTALGTIDSGTTVAAGATL